MIEWFMSVSTQQRNASLGIHPRNKCVLEFAKEDEKPCYYYNKDVVRNPEGNDCRKESNDSLGDGLNNG